MSLFQGTVARSIKFAGVGLHTGKLVNLEIHPLPPHSGIFFQRSDIPEAKPILACAAHIQSTELCTTLGDDKTSVATVEHLMAAFFGLGIDNALVKVDAVEVPILDGSAAPFVDKLSEAGIQIQPAKRKLIFIDEVITASYQDQFIRFTPPNPYQIKDLEKNPTLDFECDIEFASKAIGKQSLSIRFGKETFMQLCEARTFCHVDSVKFMRDKGLALGGSLDNAIVVNNDSILNLDGLRYSDEFVRHKLLDCIGDLALLGGSLVGKVTLHKAGHTLHAQLVKNITAYLEKKKISPTPQWKNNELGLGLVASKHH